MKRDSAPQFQEAIRGLSFFELVRAGVPADGIEG